MMTRAEAIDMFRSDDLIGIGMAADALRRKLHPENVVSYIIDRNINYTNFCTEYCSFCAFYRPMGHAEGYVHPKEVIFQKIQETLDLGGTGILMQGGLHPDLKIEWYEDLLSSIKKRYDIWCHCFSAPEIVNIAEVSGLSLRDTLARLRDAGLDSLPGGGAEILDKDVRHRISRLKCSAQDWIDVHRTCHELGMRTTATMMFGTGETIEQRMNHFDIVREIQNDTGGFTAFLHPVGVPAREHVAGAVRQGRIDRGRVLENAGAVAAVLRQYRAHSILVGDAGPQDLPIRAALRRQRRGQHHDRGKRSQRGGSASSGNGRRIAKDDSRRRVCAASEGLVVPDLFPQLAVGDFAVPQL